MADPAAADEPDDYVLATGETHTVREFAELAFDELGIALEWQGEGAEEKGVWSADGTRARRIDPRYYRPTEVEFLVGDASKARTGWAGCPTTVSETLARRWPGRIWNGSGNEGF